MLLLLPTLKVFADHLQLPSVSLSIHNINTSCVMIIGLFYLNGQGELTSQMIQ